MRLHQLAVDRDLAVHNPRVCVTLVLTPDGDVYRDEATGDPGKMVPAYGWLFSDDWRPASDEEIAAMRGDPPRRPKLERVK